ncbi:MAG: MBL fold metallo-hydrolase [Candidatus Thorarchaeota archaeon]
MVHQVNGIKNLYIIFGDNGGRFPHCHTFLFIEGEGITLFDPQCGRELLGQALSSMGKSWRNIRNIVNTHFHVDHTASNAFIKSKCSDVQIWIHQDDAEGMKSKEEYSRRYGLSGQATGHYKFIFEQLGYQPMNPDHIFKEGDLVPGGFEVIHTPGHSPGHCSFYKIGILISGDVDLVGRPWVCNVTSNVNDFDNSIKKLKKLDVDTFLPGHGQPLFGRTKIQSQLETYRNKLLTTGIKILNLIDGAMQLEEILEIRFGESIIKNQNPMMKLFRRYDTLNYLYYLEHLSKINKIEKDNQIFWKKN